MEAEQAPRPSTTSPATLRGRIIPPEEHPITRERISPDAMYVLQKLNRAGFSAYLVGGGVRDLYLDKEPKDFDISTDARPGQIRKLFPHSRTIGRRFRLVQVFFKHGNIIEVSTLRSLSEHDLDGPQEVLAPNNTYGTLDQDAQRRDLTINSLFYEIENHTIIDYVNGVEDLDRSIVRLVGDPEKRITRDPVRMMRAIRHAARNGFTIEERSWQAIRSNHSMLRLCPPSRLRDEMLKDIYGGASAAWFRLALDSGIFFDLFPIYREAVSESLADGTPCRQRLTDIFATIDRINSAAKATNRHRQPEYFLLALILIPWAEVSYRVVSEKLKGSPLFQRSKQIRAEIDRELGQHLNLSRAIRQDMSGLLTNLGVLTHNRQNDSWPKWLRKKSYFKQCLAFYTCYQEAVTGRPMADTHLEPMPVPHNTPNQQHTNDSGDRRNRPAFSPRAKKGIFGLKK